MPDTTTIQSLPLIQPSQAQKHVTHNEALKLIDVMIQLSVENRDQTAPPGSPVAGQCHIVAAGASGDWAGHDGEVAVWSGAVWEFYAPKLGWSAWIADEAEVAVFDGAAWVAASEGLAVFSELGVSATPDATNRLSVSSPAVLLNHAGAGHQLKINKAASGDTASLLFQTGFSGRAEMGTTGSDDFAIKVSPDGSTFHDGVVVEGATGRVKAMNGLKLAPAAGDLAGPADGELWYNSTTGKFRGQQGGSSVDLIGGGGGSSVFSDAAFTLQDDGDATKQVQFQLSSIGSGVTRTLTVPNASGAIVLNTNTQTLTGKTVDLASNTLTTTKAQLDAAVSDGNVLYVGDVTQYTDEMAQDAVGAMIDGSLAYVDGTPLLSRAALTGDVTAPSGSNATTLATVNGNVGSFGSGALVPVITVNAKGLITAVSTAAVSGGVSDGDKGDVIVSSSGAVWSLDYTAVNATIAPTWANVSGKPTTISGYGITDGVTLTGSQTLTNKSIAATQLTGTLQAAQEPAHTGDVTGSAGSLALTIANNAVSLAKMTQLATARFLGRATAGTGDPEALTGTQATALLDTVTSGAKGLAPASGGGTVNALFADGSWTDPRTRFGQAPMVPASGLYVGNAMTGSTLGTTAAVADQTRISPFVPAFDMTVDQMGVSISTAVGSSNVKGIIYASDASGRPAAVLGETANISSASTGTSFAALGSSVALQAGRLYWVGVRSSSTATLRTHGNAGPAILNWTSASTPVWQNILVATETFANAAATWSYSSGQHNSGSTFLVLMRVA